ncbi:MAG: hypothetical protein KC417_06675, partial [Myxococcales bacterium]|nr:hypothetical protein [Myxococcales bacterium]
VTLAQIIYETEKSGDGAESGAASKKLRDIIQRGGEKLITSLRDGPVGKFVPQSVRPEEMPVSEAERRRPLARMLEQSKEALEKLEHMADDRMRGLVNSAIGQVHQLHNEIGRLQARVEELESRLVRMQQRRQGQSDAPPGDEKDE